MVFENSLCSLGSPPLPLLGEKKKKKKIDKRAEILRLMKYLKL